MAGVTAVLSYARKDDHFYGGYITAFGKILESAVHVVSGHDDFEVFQDVEGIDLGERWEEKLAEAIGRATFLVPMVSPLFLSSRYCREEVRQFLTREQQLARGDLILPVYFHYSAKLEKGAADSDDPVAAELRKRQMFDWRDKADVPLQDPAARKAVLSLAGGIVTAIGRVETARKRSPFESTAGSPGRARHSEDEVRQRYGHASRAPLAERRILWLDDQPEHHGSERRALESYGIRITLAHDAAEAASRLQETQFAAIISVAAGAGAQHAPSALLANDATVAQPPAMFVYSRSRPPERVSHSADWAPGGATDDPDELVAMLVSAVR